MINPTFQQMLMHHYKDLYELRKENGINQFFDEVIRYNCNVHDKDQDEVIAYAINEAYRLVIVFLEDPDPLAAPFGYRLEIDNELSEDRKMLVLDIFVKMLWMQIESPTDARLVGTNFDKAEEFVRILNDQRGNRIGIIESECPTERQRNTGKWSIVTTPTPPEELANRGIGVWKEATDKYNQETIRKIIYRYDTKEDQLAILKLIRTNFEKSVNFEKSHNRPPSFVQNKEAIREFLNNMENEIASEKTLKPFVTTHKKFNFDDIDSSLLNTPLQVVLVKAGESDKLKKQIESLEASLKEKDNEIRMKDEQIAQLTKKAEAKKGLDEDDKKAFELEVINNLIEKMVSEVKEWPETDRGLVNGLLMNTCTTYMTEEVTNLVKGLRKANSPLIKVQTQAETINNEFNSPVGLVNNN